MSARSLHFLQLLAAGWEYKDIAREVGLSPFYLKRVMKGILEELGADNKTHAVALALRRHLIQ